MSSGSALGVRGVRAPGVGGRAGGAWGARSGCTGCTLSAWGARSGCMGCTLRVHRVHTQCMGCTLRVPGVHTQSAQGAHRVHGCTLRAHGEHTQHRVHTQITGMQTQGAWSAHSERVGSTLSTQGACSGYIFSPWAGFPCVPAGHFGAQGASHTTTHRSAQGAQVPPEQPAARSGTAPQRSTTRLLAQP